MQDRRMRVEVERQILLTSRQNKKWIAMIEPRCYRTRQIKYYQLQYHKKIYSCIRQNTWVKPFHLRSRNQHFKPSLISQCTLVVVNIFVTRVRQFEINYQMIYTSLIIRHANLRSAPPGFLDTSAAAKNQFFGQAIVAVICIDRRRLPQSAKQISTTDIYTSFTFFFFSFFVRLRTILQQHIYRLTVIFSLPFLYFHQSVRA